MPLSAPEIDRIRDLFHAAIEADAPDRARWLNDHADAVPTEIRAEVERLLQAHDNAGDFLAEPTVHPARLEPAGPTAVGPYRILRELGRGGFGTVYLAAQERPVRRQVALKLINPGMDTRQVVTRFEGERQAVAMMDHPAIARVYDAGATDAGRPYFVMEWIDGPSITTYCANESLGLVERLELFTAVCRAIQHAHQKGVIHRDIKPSNVLVTQQDGHPAPKVIDFGVAKALHGRLGEQTLVTGPQQLIGTPQYMSPEQAETGGTDVDTRADIYGLGVLLYELLTGTPPFDAKSLQGVPLSEMQRIIREDDPIPPSRRILEPGPSGSPDAETRRRAQALRGDLDWIVMRAIEKDRARRYPTADALAEDIQRYLANQPVVARPPSAVYRAKKFITRNRRPLLATGVAGLAILVGGSFGLYGLIEARHQGDLARTAGAARKVDQALAESASKLAETQRQLAEQRQLRVDETARLYKRNTDILEAAQNLLVYLVAADSRSTPLTAETLDNIDLRLTTWHRRLPPDLEGPVRDALGTGYEKLALHTKAEKQFRLAISLLPKAAVVFSEAIASSYSNLGVSLLEQGRYADAEAAFREGMNRYEGANFHTLKSDLCPTLYCNMALARIYQRDVAGGMEWLTRSQAAARRMKWIPFNAEAEMTATVAFALRRTGEIGLAETTQNHADALAGKSASR